MHLIPDAFRGSELVDSRYDGMGQTSHCVKGNHEYVSEAHPHSDMDYKTL